MPDDLKMRKHKENRYTTKNYKIHYVGNPHKHITSYYSKKQVKQSKY